MRILYPYNEILPKKSAHDVYIARSCAALAAAGCSVELLCGAGSLKPAELMRHYSLEPTAGLSWKALPILRKNMGLPLTWNGLFFWWSQRYIRQVRPDWVALSVLKQGAFHLKRRVPGVKYVYEVHELAWYPGRDPGDIKTSTRLDIERQIFSLADLVTVTTEALKDILLGRPYSVATPIKVIPLAVDFVPLLPPPAMDGDLELMYVGQMYPGQGLELLLKALTRTRGIRLTLVGGAQVEVQRLQVLSRTLKIEERVTFTGFIAPAELAGIVARAHAFVAPFSAAGRMPFVAHTKLLEYSAWQRPVIAPDLPVAREHFTIAEGWIPFSADNVDSLAEAMQSLNCQDSLAHHTALCRQNKTVTWADRNSKYIESLKNLN